MAQVRALTAPAPAPTGARAKEWAHDIYLVSWEADAHDVTPTAALANYREWLEAEGMKVIAAVEAVPTEIRRLRHELRARAVIRPGPCFPSAGTLADHERD